MLKEANKQFNIINRERRRLENSLTYIPVPYNQELLEALNFMVKYTKSLDLQLEERKRECLRLSRQSALK